MKRWIRGAELSSACLEKNIDHYIVYEAGLHSSGPASVVA